MSDQIPEVPHGPGPGVLTQEERTMAMLCHLLALVGYVLIPFGNILGPLIVWLIKKDESAFVDDQGKESLNFQISITIYAFISAVLMIACIGFLLFPAVYILGLIMTIIGSVKASNGVRYRYPLTIRFIP